MTSFTVEEKKAPSVKWLPKCMKVEWRGVLGNYEENEAAKRKAEGLMEVICNK